ncbi:hypothetical protein SARC_09723 [Sphaeroforma arctica JP610]|uniref:Stealth protein CR2 conserved region 2 domain-containing protein n=1 Tax=Sphaeroforma arctica JP610 TaxID=667725 RepID=A0A0L0FPC8_9EUKA|nr:hypothetical protein SARC_09723 [Sphaeroforma arctica JP610]KNC77828.1 hypothetical protein SARC_09723 [Sphaeroforma arctica JP610]|eukprot:XP_014151730.1 hypothetical protein SARC_09723 [Sphaeroforma arctica JP610]
MNTSSTGNRALLGLLALTLVATCIRFSRTLEDFLPFSSDNTIEIQDPLPLKLDRDTEIAEIFNTSIYESDTTDVETAIEVNLKTIQELKAECDILAAIWTVKNIADIPDSDCRRMEIACGINNCHAALFDAVVTWVNGSDASWKTNYGNGIRYVANLDSTLAKASSADSRFRDFDQLKYTLRSIEDNTPWVRRIYIITDNQWPVYLRPADQALRIRYVSHTDLFDNYYNTMRPELLTSPRLPCFNSITLELLTPFIPSLSNVYLNLNDDTGFLNPTPLDFVYNTTSEKAVLRLWSWYDSNFQNGMDKNALDWAKLDLLLNAWHTIPEVMESIVYHPFRHQTDPTTWPFVMLLGYPTHYESRSEENEILFNKLKKNSYQRLLTQMKEDTVTKMLCLNDDMEDDAVTPEVFDEIHEAYQSKFPKKASFEM